VRVELGRSENVIPMRVRQGDVARRRNAFRREPVEEVPRVSG
jgi:hypothetical protein